MAKINWFPGHMAKSLKELRNNVSKCDYIIETCDSRLPLSSRNPQFNKLLNQKKYMLLMTKSDLADATATQKWLNYFQKLFQRKNEISAESASVMAINVLEKSDIKQIRAKILADNQDIIERAQSRGRRIRPIRVMINGIPNTGKSTLINSLIGKKSTQVSNRPGVTRSINWLRASTDFELMDTPGILWPKFETVQEQLNLAISGAIKDDLLPFIEIACGLILILAQSYPEEFSNLFNLDLEATADYSNWLTSYELLEKIAFKLNLIQSGGKPDLDRTSRRLITEYRQGKLGRFSLEFPDGKLIYPISI